MVVQHRMFQRHIRKKAESGLKAQQFLLTLVFGRHALRLHRVAAFSAEMAAIGFVLFPILTALTVRLFRKKST